jgi:hypothetical protein
MRTSREKRETLVPAHNPEISSPACAVRAHWRVENNSSNKPPNPGLEHLAVEGREPVRLVHVALTLGLEACNRHLGKRSERINERKTVSAPRWSRSAEGVAGLKYGQRPEISEFTSNDS